MARRSTIGSNPLEAINTPAGPKRRSSAGARSPRKPIEATAAASEAVTEAAEPKQPKKASSWKWRIPSQLRLHRIHVTGGDTVPGNTRLSPPRPGNTGSFRLPSGEIVSLIRDVIRIKTRTEETSQNTSALLGWATAGAFLAGPLGALAGSLYGGRERHSTKLDIHLHDGRHILASTDPETAREMMAEIA